ncbi:ester cyclase [Rhizobium terrae]|uniref:ester cyclase n=1 Tax=Rhizobium terrae TaxID=2171756 RepID=UPI000E3E8144|nr:ester cyclase [Rhizobium terrae]
MGSISPRMSLLQEFLDRVWSAGEIDQCDRFLARQYTIRHDPGDPWDGRTLDLDRFKERVRISRAPFPDQKFDVQQWFENDQGIAVTWLWSATHRGDIPGFPASGRTITMSGATVYHFDADDRLTGHWQVTDRLGIYRQLQSHA